LDEEVAVTDPDIRFQMEEEIGFLTLNRPEKRNALSLDTMREIIDRLTSFRKDSAGKVLILRAEGPVFSSGHDLSEMVGKDAVFLPAHL